MAPNEIMGKMAKKTKKERGKVILAKEELTTNEEGEETRGAPMTVMLYGAPSDPDSILVKEYLKQKNITCKCFNVGNKQEFLALQSFGRIPVLEVLEVSKNEKHILFGSNDIMRHFRKLGRKEEKEKVVGELHETEKKRLNELLLRLLLGSEKEREKMLKEFGDRLPMTGHTLADLTKQLTYLPTVAYIQKAFPRDFLSEKISHVNKFCKTKSSVTEWEGRK